MAGPQTRYTLTEKELLSIFVTLKEFCAILLGQKLKIYTDHKNLTCKYFNIDCILLWILILEEYIPNIDYIPGNENLVADALSQLPNISSWYSHTRDRWANRLHLLHPLNSVISHKVKFT